MVTGKILKAHGWPEGRIIGYAKTAAARLEAEGYNRAGVLAALNKVRVDAEGYVDNPVFGDLARECLRRERQATELADDALQESPPPYKTWGREGIDDAARLQMDLAMRLPISVAGALMPDAHVGYGLPIGGVLATTASVIPFAVGVDIACRMRLSIYPVTSEILREKRDLFERALMRRTQFGAGAAWQGRDRAQHAVLDDPDWDATKLLRSLKAKAHEQLGTSGTGNHFVEWGTFTLGVAEPDFDLAAGEYLALLSHSGSRAVGFKIANAYSTLAEALHPRLDARVRRLAWLPLASEPGQEYWISMELAGRFASANHAVIHKRVAAEVGLDEIASVENHHNFAWRETVQGTNGESAEAIVHRKGATPAGTGVLGIIPGSMGDPGYVVRGKGISASLNSASHGAGRAMSRRAAHDTITKTARDTYLRDRGVTLLGGGLDEAPQAYKPIDQVIASQAELIAVMGTFKPVIVRMADEPGDI